MSEPTSVRSYNEQEVCMLLGVTPKTLKYLKGRNLLPYKVVNKNAQFDRAYVDGLVAKLRLTPPRDGLTDITLITLYREHHLYAECANLGTKGRRQREAIKARCDALVESGRAIKLNQLIELRNHASATSIRHWAQRGIIATVLIGGTYYLSVHHYKYLLWFFNECSTVASASARLGVPITTLYHWIRQNEIEVLQGPSDMRLTPETIKRLEEPSNDNDSGLTISQAAEIIGVDYRDVLSQVHTGAIKSTGFRKTRRIPREEAERWRRRRNTLNVGFQWLQAQIEFAGRPAKTLSAAQAARKLGIHPNTLETWSRLNLVPYYTRSFGPEDVSTIREFVALYILGLARFASAKVTIDAARQYAQRCREAQSIL